VSLSLQTIKSVEQRDAMPPWLATSQKSVTVTSPQSRHITH